MNRILFVFGVLILFGCGETQEPSTEVKFDRTQFLESYADNLIIPGFEAANSSAKALQSAIDKLNNGSGSIEEARIAWESAYLAFLNVSQYNFGPAEEQVLTKSLVEEIATFPVNVEGVKAKVNTGDFKLTDSQRDTRGFLAIEYILFENDDAASFPYLKAITDALSMRLDTVLSKWKSTFRAEFVTNNGTSAGSSTSQMYNEFLKSFESLKNFKLGLPLGLRPGQTASVPKNVEAYYSENSLAFAKQHFAALKTFWIGSNQKGFRDYLLSVEGGIALVNSTELQIKEVENALTTVSEADFFEQNLNGNQGLIALHTELQKLTRFFKSEMSSLLGIAITFSSGDGD